MEEDDERIDISKDAYVYLDFGDNVNDDLFHNKIFFRMANLETENPLIQLNDHIFKGQYDDCVGTNLFFEDVEDPEPRNVFYGENPIHLRHTVTQFKIISLNPVQIPHRLKDMPEPDYDVKINSNTDYQTLLKKFADGTLNIKDDLVIVPKQIKDCDTPNNINPLNISQIEEICTKLCVSDEQTKMKVMKESSIEENVVPMETTTDDDKQIAEMDENDTISFIDILKLKYEKLNKLSLRPNRRKPEIVTVEECDEKFQKAYEYNCIKSQVVKPSDYFRVLSKEFNRETLVGAVDIDRCVLQGVLKPSDKFYRILTEEEKLKVLSLDNFDNLSMLARYWVLKSQLEHLESSKLSILKEELSRVDKFGRTIDDLIGIHKRLLHVINGILEGNYYYNSDQDTDDDYVSSDESSVREFDLVPVKGEMEPDSVIK